jgi:ribosomal protein S18 acetylase RimI-like enzyme
VDSGAEAAICPYAVGSAEKPLRGAASNASHEIICIEGIAAGRLYLDRSGKKFHILDITLLPEHRNRGAGSFLLNQIMAEAKEAGKPVSIYVETFNPSLRLFQRLGFTPIQQEGFHLLLQCAG